MIRKRKQLRLYMKKINKSSTVKILVASLVLGLAGVVMGSPLVHALQSTVNLGTATPFAILAGTPGITNTGPSVITGNVGLSPAAGSGISGLLCTQVTGTIYAVDATGLPCFTVNGPLLVTAKNDLTTAYTDAANRIPVTTVPSELGGTTKIAGVYASEATTFDITAGAGPLVIDGQGDPSAVFIFESSAASPGLTVGPGSVVQLTGQAQACNVFWRVVSADINTTAVFKGTIMALNSITVANGANIEGRLLARNGQVTLINDTITVPTCTAGGSGSATPGLPNTGFANNENNTLLWSIGISVGIMIALVSLVIVQKKRAI